MVYSEVEYLSKYSDPGTQIEAINTIIDALNAAILSGNTAKSYEMDDGQVTIKTGYNSILDITKAILFYRQEIERIRNYVNGRKTKFIPCRTFRTVTR